MYGHTPHQTHQSVHEKLASKLNERLSWPNSSSSSDNSAIGVDDVISATISAGFSNKLCQIHDEICGWEKKIPCVCLRKPTKESWRVLWFHFFPCKGKCIFAFIRHTTLVWAVWTRLLSSILLAQHRWFYSFCIRSCEVLWNWLDFFIQFSGQIVGTPILLEPWFADPSHYKTTRAQTKDM